MATTKHRVWLFFDLGVQGDYGGLYAWLDDHDAEECGENVATFRYELKGGGDLANVLLKSLRKRTELGKRARLYLVRREGDKLRGKFILGSRKAAPWSGFAGRESAEDSEEPE